MPVGGIKLEGNQVMAVVLGSGEEIPCGALYYADRWDALPRVAGLPKNLPFIRGRDAAGVLQAVFSHSQPIGLDVSEGFFGTLHRESGETFDRHVWGHFSFDGMHSYWTICVTGDEVEDNHQIGKKLRRLKTALDKMFAGSSWLPEGKTDFMGCVVGEAMRFHEAVVFGKGEPTNAPVILPAVRGAYFMTDGYGIACALRQVGAALGLAEAEVPAEHFIAPLTTSPGNGMEAEAQAGSDAETKDMDLGGTSAS